MSGFTDGTEKNMWSTKSQQSPLPPQTIKWSVPYLPAVHNDGPSTMRHLHLRVEVEERRCVHWLAVVRPSCVLVVGQHVGVLAMLPMLEVGEITY